MEATYDRIYWLLAKHEGWMSTKALALAIDLKDRDLRSHGEDDSILDLAGRHIMKKYGLALIRRMSGPPGVRLTADIAEAESSADHWNAFHRRVRRVVQYHEAMVHALSNRKADLDQLSLPL